MHTIMGILTVTLTSTPFLGFSYLEHISFITNNLHQMCLMLDQFLWGAFVTLPGRDHTEFRGLPLSRIFMTLNFLEGSGFP